MIISSLYRYTAWGCCHHLINGDTLKQNPIICVCIYASRLGKKICYVDYKNVQFTGRRVTWSLMKNNQCPGLITIGFIWYSHQMHQLQLMKPILVQIISIHWGYWLLLFTPTVKKYTTAYSVYRMGHSTLSGCINHRKIIWTTLCFADIRIHNFKGGLYHLWITIRM